MRSLLGDFVKWLTIRRRVVLGSRVPIALPPFSKHNRRHITSFHSLKYDINQILNLYRTAEYGEEEYDEETGEQEKPQKEEPAAVEVESEAARQARMIKEMQAKQNSKAEDQKVEAALEEEEKANNEEDIG